MGFDPRLSAQSVNEGTSLVMNPCICEAMPIFLPVYICVPIDALAWSPMKQPTLVEPVSTFFPFVVTCTFP